MLYAHIVHTAYVYYTHYTRPHYVCTLYVLYVYILYVHICAHVYYLRVWPICCTHLYISYMVRIQYIVHATCSVAATYGLHTGCYRHCVRTRTVEVHHIFCRYYTYYILYRYKYIYICIYIYIRIYICRYIGVYYV